MHKEQEQPQSMSDAETENIGNQPITEDSALAPDRSPASARWRPAGGKTPPATSVDVVVHRPARTCYRYSYDAQTGALTLADVYHAPTALPGDLAHLPWDRPDLVNGHQSAALASAGPIILLLSRQPNPPETHVRARLLGGAPLPGPSLPDATATSTWLLVAVPEADPAYTTLTGIASLPAETQAAINRLTCELAFPASMADRAENNALASGNTARAHDALSWQSAEEALAVIRRATIAHRRHERERQARPALPGERLRGHDRDTPPPAAWRAITGVSPRMLHERGMDAYAEAEHLLQYVPLRFQRYLSELLLSDERVLMFIERPALARREGPLRLRARRLPEGLLLVTDRQVLWLRDFAGPDATMVAWGYVARSWPVERLSGARVTAAGAADARAHQANVDPHITIQATALHGTERFAIEFPGELIPALEQMVHTIERFLPMPGDKGPQDRRVRRVPCVEPWQPHADEVAALEGLGGLIPLAAQKQLETALPGVLAPGETLLVQALAPAIAEARVGPRLLALTAQRLILLSLPAGKNQLADIRPEAASWPLATIATAQLQHSLLGCSIALAIPAANGQTDYPSVPFNSPAIVPFRALFTRLRLLLAGPIATAMCP